MYIHTYIYIYICDTHTCLYCLKSRIRRNRTPQCFTHIPAKRGPVIVFSEPTVFRQPLIPALFVPI